METAGLPNPIKVPPSARARSDFGIGTPAKTELVPLRARERSDRRQSEKQRIENEANAKRSKAADARRGEGGKLKATPVVQHNVAPQDKDKHKAQSAKAAAAKVNPGAVARGDKLAKERPDLAEGRGEGTC